MRRTSSFLVFGAWLMACGSEPAPASSDTPEPPNEAGTTADAARATDATDGTIADAAAKPKDGAAPDASRNDAASDVSTDASDSDVISADAGFSDASQSDAGAADSDLPDSSQFDSSLPDASQPDSSALDAGPPDASPVEECNGSALLCGRRYDEVAYATTHNAMSNSDEGFLGPNQHHGITRQLEDGIRGLMLDTHYDGTIPSLCHQTCSVIGKKPLVAGLGEIKTFLDGHPHEVVSIIFESYITAADTNASFAAAGLLPLTHAHVAGQAWPTLHDLVTANERLVVFTDNGGGTYPFYMNVWDHAFETDYNNKTKTDLDCRPNRGKATNALFILNHFLTNPIASELLAASVNYDPFFIDKAHECQTKYSHLPNFVTVDFYDIGDVIAVTRALNGVP